MPESYERHTVSFVLRWNRFLSVFAILVLLVCMAPYQPAAARPAAGGFADHAPSIQEGDYNRFVLTFNHFQAEADDPNTPGADPVWDTNHGCWSAEGNNRWGGNGDIDYHGHLSAICKLDATYGDPGSPNYSSQSWRATLTGLLSPSGQFAFDIETTETITNSINGKVEWVKWKLIYDVTNGQVQPINQSVGQATGVANFHITIDLDTGDYTDYTGTIPYDITFIKDPPQAGKINLSISQNRANPQDAQNYQPYSFLIKLTETKADGSQAGLANKLVKVDNPWNDVIFSTSFIAPRCGNCTFSQYKGQEVATLKSPGDIELITNERGEAALTLLLDFDKLAQFNRIPTPAAPLVTGHRVTYTDNSSKVYEAKRVIELKHMAIIEKITFTYPTLVNWEDWAPQPNSEQVISLKDFGKNAGDSCAHLGGLELCGADRARLVQDRWWGGLYPQEEISDNTWAEKSTTLKVGDLVPVQTEILVDACYLPKTNKEQAGELIGLPAKISVQMRFFDGVRTLYTVFHDPNKGGGKGCVTYMQVVPFVDASRLSTLLKDAGMKIFDRTDKAAYVFVDSGFNVGLAVATLFNLPGGSFLVSDYWGAKASYVEVHSNLWVEAGASEIALTTREGEPLLWTPITAQGVPVPAGKTAHISLETQVSVEDTDPEVAKMVDRMLDSLTGEKLYLPILLKNN